MSMLSPYDYGMRPDSDGVFRGWHVVGGHAHRLTECPVDDCGLKSCAPRPRTESGPCRLLRRVLRLLCEEGKV